MSDLLSWFHTHCCGLDSTPHGSSGRDARQVAIGSVGYTTTVVEEDDGDGEEEEQGMNLVKTEKQVRTVLLRLVHFLDLTNAAHTPHNVVLSTDVDVDPRTGALNVDAIFQLDSRPRRSWSPELCTSWFNDKNAAGYLSTNRIKTDAWSVGIVLSELLGLDLPWSDSDVSDLPREVFKWSSENIDGSLATFALTPSVSNAISPSLSNLLFECLWVRASRRPSIREIKLHPFFVSSTSPTSSLGTFSFVKTLRGRWSLDPTLHCTQPPRQQFGGKQNSESKKKSTRKIPTLVDMRHDLQRLLQHPPTPPGCGTAAAAAAAAAGRDGSGTTMTSALFRLDSDKFNQEQGLASQDEICTDTYANNSNRAIRSVNSNGRGGKDTAATAVTRILHQYRKRMIENVEEEMKIRGAKEKETYDEIQESQDVLPGLKRARKIEVKEERRQLRRALALVLLQDSARGEQSENVITTLRSLRSDIWTLLLSINIRTSKWSYPGLLRKATNLLHLDLPPSLSSTTSSTSSTSPTSPTSSSTSSTSSSSSTRATVTENMSDLDKEEVERAEAMHQLYKQLQKDIPRCHSYHPELTKTKYHNRFLRILSAWVEGASDRMYWQGLDSMLAPILLLYEQEAMAFVVLERTIDVFLPEIFVSNNHLALQERLLGLLHLVAFLDPELSNHLQDIGVTPNLYAISWFLTMFAHVLPIDLVFRVWDVLLALSCLGPKTSPELRTSGVSGISDISDIIGIGVRRTPDDYAQGLPVLFAACLLCRLREFLLGADFASATVFLTSLPCPMKDIVPDVLKTMPTTKRLVPESVLSISGDLSTTGKSVYNSRTTTRNEHIESIKYERCPRIAPNEALSGAIFDASLIVDVRTSNAYIARHILDSINVPLTVERSAGCKTVRSQKSQLERLYVMVLGEDIASASSFASALVEYGVPFVVVIGTTADVLLNDICDASVVVTKKKVVEL